MFMLLWLTVGCAPVGQAPKSVRVRVKVDGQKQDVEVEHGATVQQALERASVDLGPLDRVDPPPFQALHQTAIVQVTRVRERFEVQHAPLPYPRQRLPSHSLPEGEERLLQAGSEGEEEITYRVVEEEGTVVSRVAVRRVVLEEPVPEIVAHGVQPALPLVSFEGDVFYASGGNAWVLEGNAGPRRPLLNAGDLDGRVFSVSPDGEWLLFSRQAEEPDSINALWLLATGGKGDPIQLGVENVVHFADWSPALPGTAAAYTIAYSTAESRAAPPGWQANNDLRILELTPSGSVTTRRTLVDTNSGGQYGWWGTDFEWSPEGDALAYGRPDQIGLIDAGNGARLPLLEVTPYQSLGDWAWIAPLAWHPKGGQLFTLMHGPEVALERPEVSPAFNLIRIDASHGEWREVVALTGMFASIAPNPDPSKGQIAYLQAVFPLESDRSRYRVELLDQGTGETAQLFPPAGEIGLEPGPLHWSPEGELLAFLYRGNLWILDPSSRLSQPLTAEGRTIAFDWVP